MARAPTADRPRLVAPLVVVGFVAGVVLLAVDEGEVLLPVELEACVGAAAVVVGAVVEVVASPLPLPPVVDDEEDVVAEPLVTVVEAVPEVLPVAEVDPPVDDAVPVDDALPLALPLPLAAPPTIVNGFEYWKWLLSASSVKLSPYTVSAPRLASTFHTSLRSSFWTWPMAAMGCRLLVVSPPIKVMVAGPVGVVADSRDQVMVNGWPAGTWAFFRGVLMESKLGSCAAASEARNARAAAKEVKEGILSVMSEE